MRAIRTLGRWLAEWQNIVAVGFAVLVALVAINVGAGFHDRDRLYSQLQSRDHRITVLTGKVDDLQSELEQVLAAKTDAERADVVQRFEQQRAAAAASTPKPAGGRASTTTSTSTRPTSTSSPPTTTSTSTTTTTTRHCIADVVCVKPIVVP